MPREQYDYVSRGENPQNLAEVLGGWTSLSATKKEKPALLGWLFLERYYAEYFRFVAKKLASFVPKERKNAFFAFLLGALHRFVAVQSHKLGCKTKNRTTWVRFFVLERITGLEPATSTLARWRSTK